MLVPSDSNLSILVVDDEPLACSRLRALCGRIDAAGHVETVNSGRLALELIAENCPDVMLLDIDMPDLSGMEVAEKCQEMAQALGRSPHIIFTTAHSRYAVKAFRLEAVDYLLKPVKQVLLAEALARVIKKRDVAGENSQPDHSLWVRDGATSLQIRTADIERIEADRDYMRLCLPDRSYLIHESMKSMESKLPANMFVRIHRSTIVRRDFIRDIRRKGRQKYVVLLDDSEVPIGPRYAEALHSLFTN